MTEAMVPYESAIPDAQEWYPFPIALSTTWQGGTITDTVNKALIVCQRHSGGEPDPFGASAYATLCDAAWARYVAEETTPADRVWPTLWGAVPVRAGPINAVWVPLRWLPVRVRASLRHERKAVRG